MKKSFGLIIVLVLSFWAIKPLFINGFFPIHDNTQVERVFEMGRSLKDGMLPIRWVSDLGYGYGYPIYNFYAPLSYYVGGVFTLMGFDALTATKIMMGIGVLFSGIFMYLLGTSLGGKLTGITAAVFYMYAPYHAIDIFVRGDVAEFWAYGFIPLVIYGLWMFHKTQRYRYLVSGVLGYGGIILSHNLTALMATPFFMVFLIILSLNALPRSKKDVFIGGILTLGFGALLTSFYWIPALLEMKYTNVLSQIGGAADFREHFVCVNQLWNSLWGFGGSVLGCVDGLSFRIGKLHILSVFCASLLMILVFVKKKHTLLREQVSMVSFCIIGFIFSVMLMIELSKGIWDKMPTMEFIQYPWRFLTLASFFASLLAGVTLYMLRKLTYIKNLKDYIVLSLFFIGLLLFMNTKLFNPQTVTLHNSFFYTSEVRLKWDTSKTSDEYMPIVFKKPTSPQEIPTNFFILTHGDATILNRAEKTHKKYISVSVKDNAIFRISIAYFPAWNITVDNKPYQYKIVENGLLITLNKGYHVVRIEFQETPIEKISNILSLTGLCILVLGIIYAKIRMSL